MAIAGQTIIVTGASTGIGAATAELLASKGANVVINFGTSTDAAESVADACRAHGVGAELAQGDVADDAVCRRIADEAAARFGGLHGLVNNAGVTKVNEHANLEGLSAEDFQRIYAVNVIGAYQMTRAAAAHIRASGGGAIVNVSSVAGIYGRGSSIAYVASKGAMNAITLSLARVLAPEIRVNTVCPGLVETKFLGARLDAASYEAMQENYRRTAVLRRYALPEDIARSILFFLDGDQNMTGQVVVSDSGFNLG